MVIFTDEQFEKLEQEEREITEEAIAAMLLILVATRNDLEKELRSFYQKYGKDGVVTYQEARKWVSNENHKRRIFVLYAFMIDRLDQTFFELQPHFNSYIKGVVDMENKFFNKSIDLEDLDLEWGVDKLTWLDRLEDDVRLWQARFTNDWKRFLLQQKDIDDVILELNKRFKSIESVVKTLAMSESTAIGSIARRGIFKELGVEKYRFYTREDERTCEVCGSMHGLTFPMSAYEIGVTASPLHPNCRCWEVPIIN